MKVVTDTKEFFEALRNEEEQFLISGNLKERVLQTNIFPLAIKNTLIWIIISEKQANLLGKLSSYHIYSAKEGEIICYLK